MSILNPIAELNLAVVDVETTGLFAAYGDRICEIGIVLAEAGDIAETYQSLINPQRPITTGASRVNGLTDQDVCNAPLFIELADAIHERLHNRVIICHNAPFDLGFLCIEFARIGLNLEIQAVIDTLSIARRFFNFRSNSLPAIADLLQIHSPNAHRALGDAQTTYHVFHHFIHRLSSNALSITDLLEPFHGGYTPQPEVVLPPTLLDAYLKKSAVEINYLDRKGNCTTRQITPLRLLEFNHIVHLVAYCHLRQAERQFRLDRIIAIDGAA